MNEPSMPRVVATYAGGVALVVALVVKTTVLVVLIGPVVLLLFVPLDLVLLAIGAHSLVRWARA